MPPAHRPPLAPEYADSPIYWFARLDRAVEQGDHAAAADAQRELDRLGVKVRYGRPQPAAVATLPAKGGA